MQDSGPYEEEDQGVRRDRRVTATPVLTAARNGEVRGAAWSEIDRNARVWTIPASRMKTARESDITVSQ